MSRNVLKLYWISLVPLLLLASSCATKRPDLQSLPSFQGGDIRAALAEKRLVTDIETTFAVAFNKADAEMRGDGALTITSAGDIDLRIYTLGFLAMELTSRDGVVKSSPLLDRTKKILLTEGLRDCIFWWKADNISIEEEDDRYVLANSSRKIWVDRKSFLPLRQVVSLDGGKELTIYYEEPVRENGRWYQSRVRIEYLRYAVTLSVKTLAVTPEGATCIYCSL
jgi:hypothetical protein